MTDELKQWEYDKGYAKGYSDGRASLIEELENRVERLEKIMLLLQPRLPQLRYSREEGLEHEVVKEGLQLFKELKTESYKSPKTRCCGDCKFCVPSSSIFDSGVGYCTKTDEENNTKTH